MPIFRERLRKLRKEKKLTQKQLAIDIGTHERVIQQYELDERKPNYDAIICFSRYFHTSSDYLLGLSDDPTIHAPTVDDDRLSTPPTAEPAPD
jgi:transcriptional regulator with XRE-family HTH domain